MKSLLIIGTVTALFMLPVQAQQTMPEVDTVASVNIERYAGKWFEIARFPNRFQTVCAGNVTAEYQLRTDGGIDVINRCQKMDRTFEQAIGFGRVVDTVSNAKLKVRFAPDWLSWVPAVWGNYWVLALAPDYSWALVGDPKRQYLWVLARTPALQQAQYQKVLEHAAKQGFDVSRLVETQQVSQDRIQSEAGERK